MRHNALQSKLEILKPISKSKILKRTMTNIDPHTSISTSKNQMATWKLKKNSLTLITYPAIEIPITHTEYKVLEILMSAPMEPMSNIMIIRHLGKNPDSYTGMHMCLCRLQKKFSLFYIGEKLFRSVRNRGYRLVQKIFMA